MFVKKEKYQTDIVLKTNTCGQYVRFRILASFVCVAPGVALYYHILNHYFMKGSPIFHRQTYYNSNTNTCYPKHGIYHLPFDQKAKTQNIAGNAKH